MKKGKVINSHLSRVIAQLGHFDKLAIGDAGMPVPLTTEKIDLALEEGIPSFMQVLIMFLKNKKFNGSISLMKFGLIILNS